MFVNVEPTPFVPAQERDSESSKLEPAFRFENIISGIHSLCSECLTTGIPPLSQMVIVFVPLSIFTFIVFNFDPFLLDSSTELVMISSNIFRKPGL